ncbi:MAG TPA: 2Fe-2S iron-sulfur cluster-binding protein [Anaerolineaceae bacterium]|nr:2Fe-2S iron-sulfur cluster-binding protein [Anaerolineaceae bacterium]
MPKLTIDGKTVDVEAGTRLVLAIAESGVPIGHRCGGKGQCTSCRVKFEAGEPGVMTDAEFDLLVEENLFGEARLSCQIEVDHDMVVHPIMTVENQPQWAGDAGPEPEELVEPEAVWYPIEEFSTGE